VTIETLIVLVSMFAIMAFGVIGALLMQRRRNRSRGETAP
jgi:preprotein translocase subunit SecG